MTNTVRLRDRLAQDRYDGIVVGAGANGLAAAITLAQTGWRVALVEAAPRVGGACRSEALTLPGFVHDVGSSIHPLGIGSPFFRTLPLDQFGLEWIQPDAPLAHPLDGGRRAEVVMLERSLDATCDGFGAANRVDGDAYRRLMTPFLDHEQAGIEAISGVALARYDSLAASLPNFPTIGTLRMLTRATRSARTAANALFTGSRARALLAGIGAHSFMALEQSPSAGVGLALAVAGHAFGWPMPKGGSQKISDALAAYFVSLGGEVLTDAEVTSLDDLPPARATLCDLTPRQWLRIGGERLPADYRRALERFRYGPSVFKMDWALDAPIPWKDEIADDCRRAATVHLGSTFAEIADAERAVTQGKNHPRPYVLLAQHSLFDPARAPDGCHTAWAYCHIPFGSTEDRTDAIESQIERFAPGFRRHILARSVMGPTRLQAFDANLVGGDISGGRMDWRQLLARPIAQAIPWATPVEGVYLCSSSTPPAPGVHGLCGYYAARVALAQKG